ncbi:MAG TPA: response regulator [Verrucomicrobiae bacterium]|nr:response regulator [Verrucomicrobiae bacterium]
MIAQKIQENGTRTSRRLLRVLLIEDSETDAFLLERALTKGGLRVQCRRLATSEEMTAALDESRWDVILADHSMPMFSATEALKLLQQRGVDVPFIIVSGHIEEETAVAAMKSGAHDYIMKDRLARLVPAVERELREAEMRQAQRECEAALRRAHDELELRVEQRTADLQEANVRLQSLLEERRRLETELLEIAENERRRIGFDIHDDLGQKLTGLLLLAQAVQQRLTKEKHPAAEDAERVADLVDQIIHHTHNLARRFSSLDVQGDDLAEVLKCLAANVEKMFNIPCSLVIKGEIPPLSANTTMQFYKIAQEAISNAVKHGKATRVWISAAQVPDQLVLTIKNDGLPFSLPEGKKNRMGLRIMNYRANTVGATFNIEPNAKNGTICTCTLPRPAASPARNGRSHAVKVPAAAPVHAGSDLPMPNVVCATLQA